MEGTLFQIIFYGLLIAIVCILLHIRRKQPGPEQRARKLQMNLCMIDTKNGLLLSALSYLMAFFMLVLMGLMIADIGFEEPLLIAVCLATSVFMAGMGILADRFFSRSYILYDQYRLILGRTFGSELHLNWGEISHVKGKKLKRQIVLMTFEGRKICISSDWRGYTAFVSAVKQKFQYTELNV